MKRQSTIVKDINKMFPPTSEKYPVCFIVDETVKVTSGCFAKLDGDVIQVIDYYGEFKGGYPWTHPKLEVYLESNGLYAEWDNPEVIAIYEA